jgi:hypothetical protein
MAMTARVQAAQTVVNAYLDQPLDYSIHDCGRMAGLLLREAGLSPRLARFGRYRTAAGAVKAIRKQGYTDLPEVLDAMGLERIPLSKALTADLICCPGKGLMALAIVLGNGNFLAFAEDAVCRVGKLTNLDGVIAWRVPHG